MSSMPASEANPHIAHKTHQLPAARKLMPTWLASSWPPSPHGAIIVLRPRRAPLAQQAAAARPAFHFPGPSAMRVPTANRRLQST